MTIEELKSKIQLLYDKYWRDYGIAPLNLALGSDELKMLIGFCSNDSVFWHPTEPTASAPMFYTGMKILEVKTSGVWVGTLICK